RGARLRLLLPERHGRSGARVALSDRPRPRLADGLAEDVIEAAVMGRLSADLYPTAINTPLRAQRSFTRYVGGFAGNVCSGRARLKVATAIVSKVGADGHGEFIRDFLEGEGVDVGWLGTDPSLNTPIVF